MSVTTDDLTSALRAAGEPTRLRILALLRRGDLAVGELVQILGQSQPRLSHHLKTLSRAGLVERLPEGAWVFYRAVSRGWAGRLLDALFAELALTSGDFARDASALSDVRERRAQSAERYFGDIADDWDRIRALHFPNEAIETALRDLIGPGEIGRFVDLGTGTGRMLSLFAPQAREAEGLDMSHQMLTVARANLNEAGVKHARVRQGDVNATPFEDKSADLVIIHQVLHFIENPARVLSEAARILKPGGRLFIVDFAPHELEFLRDEHGHHRLGIRAEDMDEWASQAGLALAAPRRFDPPKSLEQGLGVNVWMAERKTEEREVAA
ncbi:MAG: metalloregulator ArsR/SmtB family transcription factor [Pseudomonadota bacterium]